MESCPFSNLSDALDRLLEARWNLKNAKDNFHNPEDFRYSINAFIRSIKEVPQITSMQLQNAPNYKSEIKPVLDKLKSDSLFFVLSKKRDFVVHRGQLDLKSSGFMGATEIRIDKMVMKCQISPKESSEEAYLRYLESCKKDKMIRNMFGPDCDSFPFVSREWKIDEFDDDIFDVCSKTFMSVANALNSILAIKGLHGLNEEELSIGSSKDVNKLVFDREQFFKYMEN